MTLTTHATVGAIAASLFPEHPVIAFAAAFASHLAIDAIPHWDYKLASVTSDKNDRLNSTDMKLGRLFIYDLMRIGTDALFGLIISFVLLFYLFHRATPLIILLGVIGGIAPDPLQFVYWKTKSKILRPLQQFHMWIHAKKRIHRAGLGIFLQLLVVITAFSATFLIR